MLVVAIASHDLMTIPQDEVTLSRKLSHLAVTSHARFGGVLMVEHQVASRLLGCHSYFRDLVSHRPQMWRLERIATVLCSLVDFTGPANFNNCTACQFGWPGRGGSYLPPPTDPCVNNSLTRFLSSISCDQDENQSGETPIGA